mmetsp:Transcript_11174/g.20638  ORF Transcript_11174/g.20638 Transcript_11174/m.20638 type:complete len:665 (-) Transcript_11174:1144-3138(-)
MEHYWGRSTVWVFIYFLVAALYIPREVTGFRRNPEQRLVTYVLPADLASLQPQEEGIAAQLGTCLKKAEKAVREVRKVPELRKTQDHGLSQSEPRATQKFHASRQEDALAPKQTAVAVLPGTILHSNSYTYSLTRKVDIFEQAEVRPFTPFTWKTDPQTAVQVPDTRLVVGATGLVQQDDGKALPLPDLRLTITRALEFEAAWQACLHNTYPVALQRNPRSDQLSNVHKGTQAPRVDKLDALHATLENASNSAYSSFGRYSLKYKFSAGGQGEVWEAVRLRRNTSDHGNQDHQGSENTLNEIFVLKRVFVERGEEYVLAGHREAVFGRRLKNRVEIARFVEDFNRTIIDESGNPQHDMWLVFHHEGQSLDSLLYTRVESDSNMLLQPSALWRQMRQGLSGALVRREILRQVLEGLDVVASSGLVHRDIKPSNLLVTENVGTGSRAAQRKVDFQVKLADLGSMVDYENGALNAALYGAEGPGPDEETKGYRPPEAVLAGVSSTGFPYLGNDHHLEMKANKLPFHAFDTWSVGVVALELLLGTANVFELDSRLRNRVDIEVDRLRYLYTEEGALEAVRDLRYTLKSLEDFGIGPELRDKERFNQTIVSRDPFQRGFYATPRDNAADDDTLKLFGDEELDFIWSLLTWSPFKRPTPAQSLQHPYFAL